MSNPTDRPYPYSGLPADRTLQIAEAKARSVAEGKVVVRIPEAKKEEE